MIKIVSRRAKLLVIVAFGLLLLLAGLALASRLPLIDNLRNVGIGDRTNSVTDASINANIPTKTLECLPNENAVRMIADAGPSDAGPYSPQEALSTFLAKAYPQLDPGIFVGQKDSSTTQHVFRGVLHGRLQAIVVTKQLGASWYIEYFAACTSIIAGP